MQQYQEKRANAEERQKAREKEIREKLPEIAAIDSELESTGFRLLRAALNGKSSPEAAAQNAANVRAANERLRARKAELLESAGYPADYLELHYECPLCKDTGFVNGARCRCLEQKLIQCSYAGSNLSELLQVQNMANFNLELFSDRPYGKSKYTPRQNAEKNREQANKFIWNFSDKKSSNLLLYGNAGTGKTFLCSAIAKELLDHGYSVLYTSAYDLCNLFNDIRFRRHTGDEAEQDENRRKLIYSCDLLIIDDLGAEVSNSISNADLLNCINERLISQKSTVISTNLTPQQISAQYSDRFASRVCGQDYQKLDFFGPDLRQKEALNS